MILTHGANSFARGDGGDFVEIDGRRYPYVRIGNQLWLAENLDYKFDVNGSQIPIGVGGQVSTPAAWYYGNDEATYGVNGNKYGLLYDGYAAKYLNDNTATLLPDGWHVPTAVEWDTLATAVGGFDVAGTKLKSTTGWVYDAKGDDSYGFAAFPTGYRHHSFFTNLGSVAYFWTATERSTTTAYGRCFESNAWISSDTYSKSWGFSLRLVKDAT